MSDDRRLDKMQALPEPAHPAALRSRLGGRDRGYSASLSSRVGSRIANDAPWRSTM
jgi:hypothetical protein